MTRATRSSAQSQELDKQTELAANTLRGKVATKKRKRTSIAETDEQPASKQLRSGDVSIKEEVGSHELEEVPEADKLADLPNAGDVPIHTGDAEKILDILEMIDTQGLLDRVFPLPLSSAEPSSSQSASYSFRTLLKESSQHPLCVLRSAVQQLFPISFHPRSRPSVPAAQQLGFCNLALSLLDQASFHSVSIPLDLESIFPLASQSQNLSEDTDTKADSNAKLKSPPRQTSEPFHTPTFKRKYALMQKLSGTEWWTSLNSDSGAPLVDSKMLKDLPTAHAELVAILPSPSTSASLPDPSIVIPTLGSYTKKVLGPRARSIGPRRTSCGSFLDYGPFASFAPSFEGDGVEIGRMGLGETIWRWDERRRERALQRYKIGSISEVSDEEAIGDVDMQDVQEISAEDTSVPISNGDVAQDSALDGLLPLEEVAVIMAALGTLELEESVSELLERNRKALLRLEQLQKMRLGAEGGGSSDVEEGSEEWDTARGILNSLTILASLRPRSSTDTETTAPLIPAPHALRKLHRTLPVAPTQGWYGTLPPSRTSALRDDSTIRIKSGTVLHTANPTAPGAPATPTNAPGSQYQPYRAGTYQQPQQQYKPPGQTYYNGQVGAQPQSQAQQYYPNQQYGQSQYQYSSSYYQSATPAPVTNGRTTPQPAAAVGNTTYGYYNPAQPQAQRAVTNTVTAATKPNGTAAPPIPPHMRNATTWNASTSQPGTPSGMMNGYQYGAYQPNIPMR